MSALQELCLKCGIQEDAVDARGKKIAASAETIHALLAAMSIEMPQTGASGSSTPDDTELAEWDRVLPSVVVAYASVRPIHVPIVLPRGTEQVHWLIKLEDGSECCGTAQFAELKHFP
ncbi:MAG TPA: hypothetical protein VGN16_23150 [Acidobacteriaceae bacterium]|jgi:hypothetical protein